MLCSKKEVGIINVMWKNQLLFRNGQAFCCNERLNFFRLKCLWTSINIIFVKEKICIVIVFIFSSGHALVTPDQRGTFQYRRLKDDVVFAMNRITTGQIF